MKVNVFTSICVFLIMTSCLNESGSSPEEAPVNNAIQPVTSADLEYSNGQTIYIPAYSQLPSLRSDTEDVSFNFGVTLSIRNTDLNNAIVIKSIRFYDNTGNFVKDYADGPFQLAPMASTSVIISEDDIRGGIGANFILEWGANEMVTEPYIESVMLGVWGTSGWAFASRGQVLEQKDDNSGEE